ncbi:hypothetical protein [Rhodococcus sp. NPDC006774]|uniref:hypothetical protein n=1 Tax=Rhodococcus sp. NPDC006774 TaxID=3157186 RepID=UPI0033F05DE9
MTQPVATIIAACIALLAAALTLFGVWLNLRHQAQLDTNKAERDRLATRRQERADLFIDVMTAVRPAFARYQDAYHVGRRQLTMPEFGLDEEARAGSFTDAEFAAMTEDLDIHSMRLRLLDFGSQADFLQVFLTVLEDAFINAQIAVHQFYDDGVEPVVDDATLQSEMRAVYEARGNLLKSMQNQVEDATPSAS